ncbi:MAG: hypothetical protein KDD62_14895, partial [Bdellovibrionales bacterium]|nr:hypothetical protein [Bdellovibrionales bacterium]
LQAFPEYQFYFVGGGPRKAEVTEFIERHTLTNCVSMDYVPREQLSEVLSAADLHVVTMGEEYVGVVHPSKVYPLLHLKKPFVYVGSQDSALGNLLLHADLDWQVDHGDVEGFMTVLERVKAGMDSQTERILQGLSQTYRKQNSLEKLLSFF